MAICKGIVNCLQFNNIKITINQFKIVCIDYVISFNVKLNYIPCFDQHLLMNINLFIAICCPYTRGRAQHRYRPIFYQIGNVTIPVFAYRV